MDVDRQHLLDKVQKYVIFAVTIGNILEWYDIYLYIYWAPTISALFFNKDTVSVNLFDTIVFFALGFVFRPLGGIFFGRLGDRIGRKKSFLLSILLMAIPTFVMGLLPIYSQIGILAPIFLAISRILQTFPSGGELPGAFCYLYENANKNNKKFMTSFAGVGGQIGIALGAIECFLMEKYIPESILTTWGWRISFIVGGLIGLGGFFLRHKLHETKLFHEMVIHHKMAQKPIFTVISDNWKKLLTGISYGAAQTVSFHLISVLLPIYIYKVIGVNSSQNLIFSIILLALTTIPLPFFGLLGDKFGVKRPLIIACIGMLSLLYPLYKTIYSDEIVNTLFILSLFVLCFTCITALWPYLISRLFTTSERYTCIGLSFNISDGVIGGLSTVLALWFFNTTGNPGSFTWILLICCLISLSSFFRIEEK